MEGHYSYSITTSCNITRNFNTNKQLELWNKLHKKKCNDCVKDDSKENSSDEETLKIKGDCFSKKLHKQISLNKNNNVKFNHNENFKKLVALMNDQEKKNFLILWRLMEGSEDEEQKKEIQKLINDILIEKNHLYEKIHRN